MQTNYETKEHILWWIERLKQDIVDIDVTSEDYSYEQALEAAIKLQSYLTKLESGEYYA
jgi:hypothetical protein